MSFAGGCGIHCNVEIQHKKMVHIDDTIRAFVILVYSWSLGILLAVVQTWSSQKSIS